MRKIALLTIILIASIFLAGGCRTGSDTYQQIDEYDGVTAFLDYETIKYDKGNDTAKFWIRSIYSDKAKIVEASKWKSENPGDVNPYLEVSYSLRLIDMKINDKKYKIKELNFMNGDNKTIKRIQNNSLPEEQWQEIKPNTEYEQYYSAAIKTLRSQGKL